MSEQFEMIVIAAFEDEHDAQQAMAELTHAGKKQVFKLKDITHIQVDPDGNVRVEEGVEQNTPRRGRIGSALDFSLKVAKTGTITLAKTGAWLTMVGTSMLSERLAQRLRAAGIGENRLIEKAGAIPRGGLTVVTVMGQNSAGAVSQLITRAGGVVRPTADGNEAEPTAEVHTVAMVETPEPFPLTHGENRYLRKALEKVSRSFALVIPNLEEPFSDYMATAYLICRVVDNIEDCTQPPPWKEQRFEEFRALLDQPNDAHITLAHWGQAEWPGLTVDEVKMMRLHEGEQLWTIYAKVPEDARASIRRWVGEMAVGMTRFEGPEQAELFTEYGEVRVLTDAPRKLGTQKSLKMSQVFMQQVWCGQSIVR